MPYYYRYNKYNKITYNENQSEEDNMDRNLYNRKYQQREDDLDTLIIDENTVYEIDHECFERLKKTRISGRQNKPNN